jgi:hypothetical protein
MRDHSSKKTTNPFAVFKKYLALSTATEDDNIHGATHRKAGPANAKERRRCETPFDLLLFCWHVLFHDVTLAIVPRINTMK